MRRALFVFALVLASTSAFGADRLPSNHRGPGFAACRSFISISGRGDVPHWSEVFSTTTSSLDLKVPFEAFIEKNYGGLGTVYSAACFKTETEQGAREFRNDRMYADVAVGTGWRPDSGAAINSLEKDATGGSLPKTLGRPSASSSLPSPVPKGPTPNQLKYQRELMAYEARLAEIEQIKARTASKHAADRAAAQRQLAGHRQELAVADAAQRRYREELAQHQQMVNSLESAAGTCRMVREITENGPFATEAEAISKTITRIPSDGRQVGSPTTRWLNVAIGESGREDFKPGLRGYMASVPYERRLCVGKAAGGRAQ